MKLLLLIFYLFSFNSVYSFNDTTKLANYVLSKLPTIIKGLNDFVDDVKETGEPYDLFKKQAERLKMVGLDVMTCYSDIMYQSVVKRNSKGIDKDVAKVPGAYDKLINLLNKFFDQVKYFKFLTPINNELGQLGIYHSTVRMNFNNLIDSLYYQSPQYYEYFQYKYKSIKSAPHNGLISLLTLPQKNGSNLVRMFGKAALCNTEIMATFCFTEMNEIFKSLITETAYFGSIGKLEMTELQRQGSVKTIDNFIKVCYYEMRSCVDNWQLYVQKSLTINYNKFAKTDNRVDLIKNLVNSIVHDVPQRFYLGIIHSSSEISKDYAIKSVFRSTKIDNKKFHLEIFSRSKVQPVAKSEFQKMKTEIFDKINLSNEEDCHERKYLIFYQNKYKGRHALEILNRYTKSVSKGVIYVAKRSLGITISNSGGNVYVKDIKWACDNDEIYQVVIFM